MNHISIEIRAIIRKKFRNAKSFYCENLFSFVIKFAADFFTQHFYFTLPMSYILASKEI
jgi:hypothetical protein